MSNTTCPIASCSRSVRAGGLCDAHYRRKRTYGDAEFMHTLECLACGAAFQAWSSQTKYCSDECRSSYYLQRQLSAAGLTCRICGGAMHKTSSSLPQGEAAHVECRMTDPRRFSDCPICGELFEPRRRTSSSWTRACSKPCGMRLAIREGTHNLQDGKQVGRDMAKVERNWRKRRALKMNAKSEPYTKEEIAERDNYICYLCDSLVDMKLVFPDPGFATVEHVVALANGGDDTPDNVRLAHLNCNIRKGTKTLEEVRYGREETVATREDCEGRGSGTTSVLYGFDPAR